ncbi:PAS domain-containing protein [Planktothrix sp. FACHB-1365]|uniref:PAS domain-containing protein n=1 Tax=Planktothrix sp. FACHB-1365 TaxID=2692855 RepID=UPI0018EF583B|nr:PAS domain-containing protein [Planktothrix sp. FACHB-1365]
MNIHLSKDSFSGQGEIHELICSLDWSKTLLGPPSQWPQSLRTAVSIILNSRYPMFIWWGEEYINLYNEAYRPILGTRKHPQFFGQSAKECWAEVWDVVGLLAESVLHTGQPTWSENLMLIMHRYGYTEETYFTFSYSPITDESGGVGGIFCTVTETTEQIIGERRLQTLREIATATTDAKTVETACQRAIQAIASNNMDIPFALLYRIQEGKQAVLAGTAGIEPHDFIALSPINLTENSDPWQLNLVNQTGETLLLKDLNTRFQTLPQATWDEPSQAAMVIPLTQKSQSHLAEFLILGISPRRAFDDSYRGFFDLIANHVATAIANAQAYETERQRSEALADIEGLEARADDYLIKPFSARELLARVHSMLELTRLRQEATIREQELKTTKAQVIDILESITDGFFALDHQWRFTYINQASERLFLKTRGELLGCNLWEIYPNFLESIEAQKLHEVMENQEAEHFETSTIHPGFWYEAQVYPYQEGLAVYWRDITERKQAEVALRLSEERFRVAQELSLDAFTILQSVRDETGTIIDFEWTYVNPKAADILQQTVDKLIGKRLLEVLPGNKTNSDLFERYVRVVETGEPHDIELSYQSEGIMGWFRNMCVKIGDGVAISFSDISDRKLSEAALLQSEERLRVALKSAPITLFNQDKNLRYTWIYNPFLKQSADEIIGRSDFDLLPDEQASQLVQLKSRVLETATGAREELCLSIEGQKYYFDLTIEPLRNTQDEVIGVTCSGVNISDHKQVELALRESEGLANAIAEELRTFMETVPAAVWVAHDPQCHDMTANRAAHQLVQLPSGGIVTATPEDGSYPFSFKIQRQGVDIPPEDLPMQRAGRTGEDVEAEFEFVFENGEVRYIYGRAVPLRDERGKIRGVIGAFLDISDRKRAEEELREREQRFITLFNGMEDWVLVYHLTPDYRPGRFIEVNQQACNRLGFSREELLRMSVADIVGSSWVYPQANIEQLLEQKRLVAESVHRTKQGERIPVEVSATLFTLNGLPTVQAICRDITDRKQAEQEREKLLTRERAAREEAEVANRIKDEFLAVLSHELRSPLNPILGWTKLLQTRKFDAAGTARALETIERNAKLQTQLIEDLLDISRILRGKMALNMEPVNLIPTIQAALETVKLAAEAKGIQVTFEVISLGQVLRSSEALSGESPGFIYVLGDETRLQQVMWNLLSNAIKFTPAGGIVEVRLECREGQAQIQVKDTGKGINSEFLPFVFDYFRQEDSTTTRKFGGLGLGLAIVRHLTELHGGTVSVDSLGEGQGSVFLVQLPLMEYKKEQPQSPTTDPEEIDLIGLKILVVDDEVDIRDLVEFILEQAGAQVRVANGAREALALMSDFAPDVLVSDIGMPEMDGYGLIAEVRKTSSIPAIALTAYAGETNHALALAAGFQVHLAKPIEPDELVLCIINLTKK